MKAVGVVLILSGMLLIAALRVIGMDLTEGQLFMEYVEWWGLSAALLFGGYWLAVDDE